MKKYIALLLAFSLTIGCEHEELTPPQDEPTTEVENENNQESTEEEKKEDIEEETEADKEQETEEKEEGKTEEESPAPTPEQPSNIIPFTTALERIKYFRKILTKEMYLKTTKHF
jgi:hypothetical protein